MNVSLFHADPQCTQNALSDTLDGSSRRFVEFRKNVNLINGYSEPPTNDSIFYVTITHERNIPKNILQSYKGKNLRVGCLSESPNIHHVQQYDVNYLKQYFDICLTYWKDLIDLDPEFFKYCPFIYDACVNDLDNHLWRTEKVKNQKICIILNNTHGSGDYQINGISMKNLYSKREEVVNEFRSFGWTVDCYGNGWENGMGYVNGVQHKVDVISKYDFNIIVENTDARGYCSEKIYDCLVAGTIPYYYGDATDLVDDDLYINMKNVLPTGISKRGGMLDDLFNKREAILDKVSPYKHFEYFSKYVLI